MMSGMGIAAGGGFGSPYGNYSGYGDYGYGNEAGYGEEKVNGGVKGYGEEETGGGYSGAESTEGEEKAADTGERETYSAGGNTVQRDAIEWGEPYATVSWTSGSAKITYADGRTAAGDTVILSAPSSPAASPAPRYAMSMRRTLTKRN